MQAFEFVSGKRTGDNGCESGTRHREQFSGERRRFGCGVTVRMAVAKLMCCLVGALRQPTQRCEHLFRVFAARPGKGFNVSLLAKTDEVIRQLLAGGQRQTKPFERHGRRIQQQKCMR